MTVWWHELTEAAQVFWGIAIIFSLLFLIQFSLSMIGADFDGDADIDVDLDVDIDDLDGSEGGLDGSFSLFSLRSILAFFTLFGWAGVLVLANGRGLWIALTSAVISGFIAMFAVAYLMMWFSRLTEEGNINLSAALLSIGEVYLTIPAKQSGLGKIHLQIGNSLKVYDAATEGKAIPTGSKIRVVQLLPENVFLVELVKDKD